MTKTITRQVWQTHKAGALDRLTLIEQQMPILSAEKIRVTVKAVGLNFADIFALTGLYSATPEGAFIPGLEFSGVISEIPADITTDFQLGDRVMGVCRFGGYATVLDIEPHYLSPIPSQWSDQQGAAYLVQTLTAYYGLTELGSIKPRQDVLIHSAAGGVGLQAMKLITAMGANAIGTVSSLDKKQYLNQLGFNDVLIREPDFSAQLKREKRTFDLVLDGIGGAVQKASFKHLNPMGRLVVFGAAEFTPGKNRPNYLSAAFKYFKRPKYDVMDMISDNKSVMAFNLIWLWQQVGYMTQLIDSMQAFNISAPYVGHEFSFEDAHEAIQCLREGNTIGKVVLLVG